MSEDGESAEAVAGAAWSKDSFKETFDTTGVHKAQKMMSEQKLSRDQAEMRVAAQNQERKMTVGDVMDKYGLDEEQAEFKLAGLRLEGKDTVANKPIEVEGETKGTPIEKPTTVSEQIDKSFANEPQGTWSRFKNFFGRKEQPDAQQIAKSDRVDKDVAETRAAKKGVENLGPRQDRRVKDIQAENRGMSRDEAEMRDAKNTLEGLTPSFEQKVKSRVSAGEDQDVAEFREVNKSLGSNAELDGKTAVSGETGVKGVPKEDTRGFDQRLKDANEKGRGLEPTEDLVASPVVETGNVKEGESDEMSQKQESVVKLKVEDSPEVETDNEVSVVDLVKEPIKSTDGKYVYHVRNKGGTYFLDTVRVQGEQLVLEKVGEKVTDEEIRKLYNQNKSQLENLDGQEVVKKAS